MRGMALTKESAVMLVAVILTLMLGRVGSVGLRWDLVLVKLEVGNNHMFIYLKTYDYFQPLVSHIYIYCLDNISGAMRQEQNQQLGTQD